MADLYAFCETIACSGVSPWHIRKLTNKGLKLGGGADTKALCGREAVWDLDVEMTNHHLSMNCCRKCATVYWKVCEVYNG